MLFNVVLLHVITFFVHVVVVLLHVFTFFVHVVMSWVHAVQCCLITCDHVFCSCCDVQGFMLFNYMCSRFLFML